MSTLGYFLTLTGCALATYLTRMPALALSGRFRLPVWLMRLMNYVGPAVLAALIAPSIFAPEGTLELNPLINYGLPAAAVTVVLSITSRYFGGNGDGFSFFFDHVIFSRENVSIYG